MRFFDSLSSHHIRVLGRRNRLETGQIREVGGHQEAVELGARNLVLGQSHASEHLEEFEFFHRCTRILGALLPETAEVLAGEL